MRLMLCLLMAAIPLVARAEFTPDAAGAHFLKMVLSDDYRKALEGGMTAIDWHIPKSEEKITAFALSKAFRDYPEEANARFTGKWITVGGAPTSLGLDPDGKPFVEYGVSNESIQNVHATFDTTTAFMQGQVDWVICKSAGTRRGAPILEHCIFKFPTTEHGFITPEIDDAVNRWLTTGKEPWFAKDPQTRFLLFVFYWAERKLPSSSNCETNLNGRSCTESINYVISNLRGYPDFDHAYSASKVMLGLPDMPRHNATK